MREILSPTNDFVFKQLLGDKNRLEYLADFLQAVLDLPPDEYDSLTIVDPHLKKEHAEDKLGILDVKIHTKSGKIIDVEMQVEYHSWLWQRIQYYTAKMITEQIKSGLEYDTIHRVVTIVITSFTLIDTDKAYSHHLRLRDETTGFVFPDSQEIHILELAKLPRHSDGSHLWNWLRFLAAETKGEFEMVAKKDPVIGKVYGTLMELSRSERARLLADEREKARRDAHALMKYHAEKGMKMGLEEGMEKGMEKGMEIGREEGEKETSRLIARNLLGESMSHEKIAELTGLPLAEVEKLAGKPRARSPKRPARVRSSEKSARPGPSRAPKRRKSDA